MGIGSSLFLGAFGAILAFAVEVRSDAFDVQAAGVILMLTGVLGLVLSVVYWDTWWGGWTPSGRRTGRGRTTQAASTRSRPRGAA